jgi:RND superfamily putative drug exporter
VSQRHQLCLGIVVVLGAVAAVLIDAFVVRALLVPALMRMVGEANWWSPAPLRRLHNRLGISESGPPRTSPRPRPVPARSHQ